MGHGLGAALSRLLLRFILMRGPSFDPDDFDVTPRDRSSPRAEVDRWLETMESLLSDVADDPEVAEPLARVIARTKASQEAAAGRGKRALSSIDSLLGTKRPRAGKSHQISDEEAEAALLSLEKAILRQDLGDGSSEP